jgi:hypothetical protein
MAGLGSGGFDVRLSPNSGARADIAGGPSWANSRLHAVRQNDRPFDHPAGEIALVVNRSDALA